MSNWWALMTELPWICSCFWFRDACLRFFCGWLRSTWWRPCFASKFVSGLPWHHLSLFPCLGCHGSWLAKQARHPERSKNWKGPRSPRPPKNPPCLWHRGTPSNVAPAGAAWTCLAFTKFLWPRHLRRKFLLTFHRFKADLCGRACTQPTFPKALLLFHHWGRSRPHCLQQGHCSVSNVIVAFFVAPRWSHKWLLHILWKCCKVRSWVSISAKSGEFSLLILPWTRSTPIKDNHQNTMKPLYVSYHPHLLSVLIMSSRHTVRKLGTT